MRAVLDTNVLLSGLLWRGAPYALVAEVRSGRLSLFSSRALITEFEAVITRSKFRRILAVSDLSPVWLMTELRSLVEIVDSPTLNALVSRDPDDDAVLAAAVAAKADIIVSGDADLLILGGYADIPIMTPAQALAIIGPEFP